MKGKPQGSTLLFIFLSDTTDKKRKNKRIFERKLSGERKYLKGAERIVFNRPDYFAGHEAIQTVISMANMRHCSIQSDYINKLNL